MLKIRMPRAERPSAFAIVAQDGRCANFLKDGPLHIPAVLKNIPVIKSFEGRTALFIGAPVFSTVMSASCPAWSYFNCAAEFPELVRDRPAFATILHTLFLRGSSERDDPTLGHLCCNNCLDRLLATVVIFNMVQYRNRLFADDIPQMIEFSGKLTSDQKNSLSKLGAFMEGRGDLSFIKPCTEYRIEDRCTAEEEDVDEEDFFIEEEAWDAHT